MKVICAGLSKTGTKSIAKALRILGYNVYDLDEHWLYHLEEWNQMLDHTINKGQNGDMPDFERMYTGVDAVTDSPACLYYRELLDAFPDAKVILSVRESEERWLESYNKTVKIWQSEAKSLRSILGFVLTPSGRKWGKLLHKIGTIHFHSLSGKPEMAQVYSEHNANVQATVPQDQLLVFHAREGWKPLCDFLGHEVPDISFPRENCGSDSIPGMVKHSSVAGKVTKELNVVFITVAAVVAVLCLLICSYCAF